MNRNNKQTPKPLSTWPQGYMVSIGNGVEVCKGCMGVKFTRNFHPTKTTLTAGITTMNYDTATAVLFTATVCITDAYNAAQDWIANEAPVIEQQLKRRALIAAIAAIEFAIAAIEWLSIQLDKAPEYAICLKLVVIRAKRNAIQSLVRHERAVGKYQALDCIALSYWAALWMDGKLKPVYLIDRVLCLK